MKPGTRVMMIRGGKKGETGTVVDGSAVMDYKQKKNHVAVRWDYFTHYDDTQGFQDFHAIEKVHLMDLEITETKLWKILA